MEASVKPASESTTVSLDQFHDERKNSTVNGCIVYTRVKRSLNSCNSFSEDVDSKRFKENAEVPLELENGIDCCTGGRDGGECGDELKSKVPVTTFRRITRSAMKAKVESGEETVTVLEQQGEAVGTVNKDDGKVPVRIFKRITRSAMKEKVESGEDKEDKVNVLEQHGSGAAVARGKGNGKVLVRDFKRVTRLAMKVKDESGEDKVTELEQQGAAVASGEVDRTFKRVTRSAAMKAGEEMVTELKQDGSVVASEINGAFPASRNKLELKMSKKIVVNKKPTTVKELFLTGLLDGVSVVYIGGIKKGPGLRGVIRDGGILCSCSLCNGRRVIPPSQFEIHACKQYKRAVEYICLENGKSLIDLLRACRGAPLHALEATIQNFVCSTPEEKYFTCKRCKGCFPSCMKRGGPICCSCVESSKSEETAKNVVGKRIRSPRPVLASKLSCASELAISSKSHQ